MSLREKIAFAIWNDANPKNLQDAISIDNLGEIVMSMGDGITVRQNLTLDWRLNRDSFLKLADVAIAAVKQHDEL